jgi:hypothetical protein
MYHSGYDLAMKRKLHMFERSLAYVILLLVLFVVECRCFDET